MYHIGTPIYSTEAVPATSHTETVTVNVCGDCGETQGHDHQWAPYKTYKKVVDKEAGEDWTLESATPLVVCQQCNVTFLDDDSMNEHMKETRHGSDRLAGLYLYSHSLEEYHYEESITGYTCKICGEEK